MSDLSTANPSRAKGFDVQAIRRDFPILSQEVNGKPLVYLDNGASAHDRLLWHCHAVGDL